MFMPLAALLGAVFALMLEQVLPGGGELSTCSAGIQECWRDWISEMVMYSLAAILFVLLPALMEPDEPFGVAIVFYGVGVLAVLGVHGGSGLGGLWESWPLIFPPIVTGLACVCVIGRVRGCGVAHVFVPPLGLTRRERISHALRRVSMVPLALVIVFSLTKGAAATEDWIYAQCPPGNFIENDSEPAYCINPDIERLVTLNGYIGLLAPFVLCIGAVALLEPLHKGPLVRLVWLTGSGYFALLTPVILLASARYILTPVLAFALGAVCVWTVERVSPAMGRLEP